MADFWDKEELVDKLTKNSREEIQIKKVEKSGKKYIDIRTFWFDSNDGQYKPSQKGITIAVENFAAFKDIINSID